MLTKMICGMKSRETKECLHGTYQVDTTLSEPNEEPLFPKEQVSY